MSPLTKFLIKMGLREAREPTEAAVDDLLKEESAEEKARRAMQKGNP